MKTVGDAGGAPVSVIDDVAEEELVLKDDDVEDGITVVVPTVRVKLAVIIELVELDGVERVSITV